MSEEQIKYHEQSLKGCAYYSQPFEKDLDNFLEKAGLETYKGCAVPLIESVAIEFGQDIAIAALRHIQLSDREVKSAVYRALIDVGIQN